MDPFDLAGFRILADCMDLAEENYLGRSNWIQWTHWMYHVFGGFTESYNLPMQ